MSRIRIQGHCEFYSKQCTLPNTAYELLIENFRKIGFFDDADECYYQFRLQQFKSRDFSKNIPMWFFDLAALAFFGYGTKPAFPLIWSTIIIIICGAFFFFSNSIQRTCDMPHVIYTNASIYNRLQNFSEKLLSIRRINFKFIKNYLYSTRNDLYNFTNNFLQDNRSISFFEALLFSATYFTSGGSSLVSSLPEHLSPVGKSRYVVVLERILGWLFLALFVTALFRTVMR